MFAHMQKKIVITSLFGALLLVGAGCANDKPNTLSPTEINNQANTGINTENQTENTTTPNEQTNNESSDITLNAAAAENKGEVHLNWNTPENMSGSKFQVTHSSTSGRTVADGAFWQNLPSSTTEYTWKGVPSGTRYFKVCELKDDKCVRTSNEVVVEVK